MEDNKIINIEAEMCVSWGYNSKIRKVEEILSSELQERGYKLNIKFIKAYGGYSEYYIYLVKNEEKNIIFSNSEKHDNIKGVVDKIISLSA